MKLIEAHATNYRNIIDADPVAIGQTTSLVGKNEAGSAIVSLPGGPSYGDHGGMPVEHF